ncbi:MAG: hypothetical protein ABJB47_02315, partial [Actinomycetota bacterium]
MSSEQAADQRAAAPAASANGKDASAAPSGSAGRRKGARQAARSGTAVQERADGPGAAAPGGPGGLNDGAGFGET